MIFVAQGIYNHVTIIAVFVMVFVEAKLQCHLLHCQNSALDL